MSSHMGGYSPGGKEHLEAVAEALCTKRKEDRKNMWGVVGGVTVLAAFATATIAFAYYSTKESEQRRAYWAQPLGYTMEVSGAKLLITAYDPHAHKYNALALAPQPAAVLLDPNMVHNAWESSQKARVER